MLCLGNDDVEPEHGDALTAAFNKFGLDPLLIRILLKGKCFESANTLSPPEFENSQIDRSFPKTLARRNPNTDTLYCST